MANAQFLILLVPDAVKVGGNVRLVAIANSEAEVEERLQNLDSSITGRLSVAEVKRVYDRRPAVQNHPVDGPLVITGE